MCRLRSILAVAVAAVSFSVARCEARSAHDAPACGQLAARDAELGAPLEKWAMGNGHATSRVLLLAGRREHHWDELRETLGDMNPFLERDISYGVIDAARAIEQGEQVTERLAAWLLDRQIGGKIPWSVAFIKNADKMDLFDLNELLKHFWKQERCVYPSLGLDTTCDTLLVVLSTSFGQEEALEAQQQSGDGDKRKDRAEDAALRSARLFLGGAKLPKVSALIDGLRQILVIILGSETLDYDQLVKEQDEARQRARAAKDAHTGHAKAGLIDVSVMHQANFIGQEHIFRQVEQVLDGIQAGLKTSKGPVMLLFAGPAGLGKTMLAQLVAQAYNGGEPVSNLFRDSRFVSVDMGNYQDERAVDGFVDPSPGLQGTGVLSTAFSKEKRSVILLDEIEKAHPSLLRYMMLPLTDNSGGHIQVKKTGERISTEDAIFILTTNCFGNVVDEMFGSMLNAPLSSQQYDEVLSKLANAMRDPTQKCFDAHPAESNPFASKPLWRRLQAGNSLANKHGLHVFLPPTPEQVDELVLVTLENFNEALPRFELYYSHQVLKWLQKMMRLDFAQGRHNMGTVASYIESMITPLLPRQPSQGARNVILVLNSRGALDVLLGEAASALDTDNMHYNRHTEKRTELDPTKVGNQGSSSSFTTSSDKSAAARSGRSSEALQFQEEVHEQKDTAQEVETSQDVSLERDNMLEKVFQFALTAALFYFLGYLALPAVKLAVGVVSLGLAVIYLVSPALFHAITKAAAVAVKFLYRYRQWVIPGATVLYGAWWLLPLLYRKKPADSTSARAKSAAPSQPGGGSVKHDLPGKRKGSRRRGKSAPPRTKPHLD